MAIAIAPSRPSEGQSRNSREENVQLENSSDDSDDSNSGGNENNHQQNHGWSQRSHDNTTDQRGTSRGALNSQDDQHNSGMSWAKGGENYNATQDTDHGYRPGIEEQRRFLASLSSSDDPYLGGSSGRFRNVDEQMQSLGYGYGSSNDNYESSHSQFDGANYGSSYGSTGYHGYDYSSSGNISGRYSHQLDGYVDHHRYNDHLSSGASGAGYHSHDYGSFDSAGSSSGYHGFGYHLYHDESLSRAHPFNSTTYSASNQLSRSQGEHFGSARISYPQDLSRYQQNRSDIDEFVPPRHSTWY